MNYKIIPSFLFLKQTKTLETKTLRMLKQKIILLDIHPFRFKRLKHSRTLFRIRFKDKSKEKRLIYEIDKNTIKLLFILNRDKNYKDLETYLKKIKN